MRLEKAAAEKAEAETKALFYEARIAQLEAEKRERSQQETREESARTVNPAAATVQLAKPAEVPAIVPTEGVECTL